MRNNMAYRLIKKIAGKQPTHQKYYEEETHEEIEPGYTLHRPGIIHFSLLEYYRF